MGTALRTLSKPKAEFTVEAELAASPSVAEVISMEPEFEPASAPPAYPSNDPTSATATEGEFPVPPVRDHAEFPVDCAVPSDLDQKMQLLQSMGFSMSFDALRQKLDEFHGDMQQVINSLL